MTSSNIILTLAILICISCSQPSDKKVLANTEDSIPHKKINCYQVDTSRLLTFKWTQLNDTTKYSVRYLQLNFLSFPNDSSVGQDIIEFTNAISNGSFLLSGIQKYQLYQLISDTSNFSEGDCGTFHLNAGFLLFDKDKICGTISIGCGYNQCNFSSANLNSKYGALNDKGFVKMQKLLDDINLSAKK